MFGQDAEALRLQTSSETDSGTGQEECDPRGMLVRGRPAKGALDPRLRDVNESVQGRVGGGGKIQTRPVSLQSPSCFLQLLTVLITRQGMFLCLLPRSAACSSRTETEAHPSAWSQPWHGAWPQDLAINICSLASRLSSCVRGCAAGRAVTRTAEETTPGGHGAVPSQADNTQAL